jgi:hypothetical protein
MQITIKIECDTINEFAAHLTELKKQVKARAKERNLNPLKDEFLPKDYIALSDNNCYGTHDVVIKTSK